MKNLIVNCGYSDTPNMSGQDRLIQDGPLIPIQIGYNENLIVNGKLDKQFLLERDVIALIDTGANIGGIDEQLAKELKLPKTGNRVKKAGYGGISEHDEYRVQIYIPSLDFFFTCYLTGSDLRSISPLYSVLLGRREIQFLKMNYDGLSGQVTLSNTTSD